MASSVWRMLASGNHLSHYGIMPRKKKFNRGEWEVQRERLRLEREQPPPEWGFVAVADVVPSVLKKMGVSGPVWFERLRAEWPEIVGSAVARYCRPERLVNKVVYVGVKHPIWLMELKRLEKELLEKIRAHAGAKNVVSLRLQLSSEEEPSGS